MTEWPCDWVAEYLSGRVLELPSEWVQFLSGRVSGFSYWVAEWPSNREMTNWVIEWPSGSEWLTECRVTEWPSETKQSCIVWLQVSVQNCLPPSKAYFGILLLNEEFIWWKYFGPLIADNRSMGLSQGQSSSTMMSVFVSSFCLYRHNQVSLQ